MTKKLRLFLTMLFLTLLGGANAAWAADTWVKTAPSSLQTGDIVVIVDETSKRAMSNDNGTSSAPTATAVTLNGDKITSTVGENIQWEVSVSNVNSTDYYSFKVYNTDNYLYCTNTNNGVRVGTSENTVFSIFNNEEGVDFLLNEVTSRYLGVYNSQDWRCYTSINTNINNTVTTFYKKVSASGPVDPSVTISAETVEVGKTITISGPSGLAMQFESDDESVATVSDEGVVTGVAAGEATITASWAATTDYNSGSKEFTVTVTAAVPSTVYEKVTKANQLVAGNEYILVAEESSMAMGKYDSKKRSNVSVTISNHEVEITNEEVAVLTLGGISGAWTLLASDDSKYLALTGNSNELHASDDASLNTSKWVITDNFQLETNAQSDTRYLRYNSGNPRFACYKSGQVEAFLYVKSGSSTNTKAEPGFSFGASTAEASLGEDFTAPEFSNPNNVTVLFTSSEPSVATIDESGNVTIVAAGTTTISASSEATDNFLAGFASYTLTVTDPNAPGTEDNPYTVAQANEAIANGTGLTNVYVKGIVSQVDEVSTEYGNATYWISDDGTTSGQLEAYRGKYLNNTAFTSVDQIQVGDEVVVFGTLKDYNGTNEFTTGNYLISLDRPNQPKYYVVGYHNNWDNGSAVTENLKMKLTADGTLKVSVALGGEGQNGDFKIIKVENVENNETTTWYGHTADGAYWITAENHTNIALEAGNGLPNLHLNTYGTYEFTLDISGDQPTLTVGGNWPEKTYYLAGDFNSWNTTATPLTKNTDGTYTVSQAIAVDEKFKIIDSDETWYGAVGDGDFWVTTEISDNPISMSTTGNNLIMKAENSEAWTLTFDATANTLTITGWPNNLNILFHESFNLTNGTGGNDDQWNGTIASSALSYDNEGWTGENASGADKCAKIGSSKKGGHLTTPTLSFESGKTYVLTFKAAAWNTDNENTTLLLSATSGTLTNASVELKKAEWTKYTVYMMNTTGEGSIKFYTESGNSRFFLDEIKIEEFDGIPVTIGSTGYGTLYYSDMPLAIPEGVTASIVTNVEGGKITFEELSDVIPAGTGVVLNANAGDYKFMPVSSTAEAPDDNLLKGSDVAEETTGGGKYYMLSLNADSDPSSVGFYYGAANGGAFTNGAHKAYLVVGSSTGAKSFYLFNDAITDGIGAVESTRFNAQGTEIYNLNGQRVSTPQRGIYIINGKKVLVK